ncbi:LacI family DNA-binding transcriptional regulator [Palleronia sp. LCG004]|uniref:LacI family DNA-binding transcriptional regulator n=1 Tax=Palleronia sp. LCG004 TaxID=3079304 RepID=UPI002942E023|nr:LacI family DNA-binding transcriptional regulator [Palleronia sp. LCG004]WOI57684.1 LacI family DNA-binding transcriptional regulator [Palleronia sp. LCG004]
MSRSDRQDGSRPLIQTMEELSAAIGVSRPTLSRYFQDPSRVSAASVRRIEEGLSTVEYVPNFFATRMNRKSTGIIGVIIPYLNDLFFTNLLKAVEMAAMEAGFTVITQCSHDDPAIEARAVETFLSMSVDGALVAPLGDRSDARAHTRLDARLPYILMDSRPHTLPQMDYVGTDHPRSTRLIVDYLCDAGDPPAFLAMPGTNFNALERERAYVDRMESLGHEPIVIGTKPENDADHYESHGFAVLDDLFSRGLHTQRSILCANDRVAIGALAAAARHGLDPGGASRGGLRIAGHDDYPLCPFTTPSLTTVAQDVAAIGRNAVRLLTEKIHAKSQRTEPALLLFEGVLKVRQSA